MPISSRLHWWWWALSFVLGCSSPPVTTVDAGTAFDAGVVFDAGIRFDAGTRADSGVPDAGPSLPRTLTIRPGEQATTGDGLSLSHGGDTDTTIVMVGAPLVAAIRTGNGVAVTTSDGNSVADSYAQFEFPDAVLRAGVPSSSVIVEVEYLDEGHDAFTLEYDALLGAFQATHQVIKTNTGRFKRARFVLSDVYFGNRDNGADLRLDDRGDGAETIRSLTFTVLPAPRRIDVDSCGANPFDDLPDADAIQQCIDQAKSGDVVLFHSAHGQAGYRGYLIEKTVFLVGAPPARAQLTFTSTDPADKALLMATPTLKGFIVRLLARSALSGVQQGQVDDITISHLHLDGNRAARWCFGPNGVFDGIDDNWGSSRSNECGPAGDSWCSPGSLSLGGAFDFADPTQDFRAHPDAWSTGLLADDLLITNTTCGTALGLNGADSVIARSTVDTAGDHVHAAGCTKVHPTSPVGDWSDGMTLLGPSLQIVDNVVNDPSDVGIVLFGGHETAIVGNTVRATAGNHGMFAAIALHAWTYGENGSQVIARNQVVNAGDSTCGGIHAGINLGPHMWGGACTDANASGVGSPAAAGSCANEPVTPGGGACPASGRCQQWAYVPTGAPLQLEGNQVTGAHVNYLVEGLDAVGAALLDVSNGSTGPRLTDWGAATSGCDAVTWAPADRIAHHPSRSGWLDVRVHCER